MTLGHFKKIFKKAIKDKVNYIAIALKNEPTEIIFNKDFDETYDKYIKVLKQEDNKLMFNYLEIKDILADNSLTVLIKKIEENRYKYGL